MISERQIKENLLQVFCQQFKDDARVEIYRAPGRVNLIGEHTDYNDGFVLPMTIDRAVYTAIRAVPKAGFSIYSLNFEEKNFFEIKQIDPNAPHHWSVYLKGVVNELYKSQLISPETGIQAVICGNIPNGAGLSSSAALEVSFAYAMQRSLGFAMKPEQMAQFCQRVEHIYAGVRCGIMDQFASRLGKKGHALFLDCRTLEYRHIKAAFKENKILIVDSGVKRKLASSKYNERRAECEAGIQYFQKIDPSVEALRDISLSFFREHAESLPDLIRKRCRHVVTENYRVQEAAQSLDNGDLVNFGKLMNESHMSLQNDYEVSAPELDLLVGTAQEVDGVLGARMTGAGFGGCIVCLLEDRSVESAINSLAEAYRLQFEKQPAFYLLNGNYQTEKL